MKSHLWPNGIQSIFNGYFNNNQYWNFNKNVVLFFFFFSMIWSIQIFGDHKNELHEEKHDSLLICWTICKKSIKPQTIEICWKQLHLHWLTVHKNIFIAIKNDNQNPDQRRSTNNNSHSVVAELSYRTESGQRPRCRLKKKKNQTVHKHCCQTSPSYSPFCCRLRTSVMTTVGINRFWPKHFYSTRHLPPCFPALVTPKIMC